MSVSAIIVTYNRLSLLKKCVKGLLNQSVELDNIFIVNNNSKDGTKQYLDNIHDGIVMPINLTKNIGGAGGFSRGLKFAYKHSSSSYFWLMDDDTVPTNTALFYLLTKAHKLHNKFGYLCSNVRWWKNNKPAYLNVPVVSNDWNIYANKGLIKTISASFVSLFVPRMLVTKVGLPISQMFIWEDDVEYTTRLSRVYSSYFVPSSLVIHESNDNKKNPSSFKSDTGDFESVYNVPMKRLLYYKCMFRNEIYISKKYYKFHKTVKLLIKDIFTLLQIPFKSNDHRYKRFMATLIGMTNGLFFHPSIDFPDKRNL